MKDVSKESIFLEALCDHVCLQARTWTSPSACSNLPFISIKPTENDRQILCLLRPGDVFSIEGIHFQFQSSPLSSSRAKSEKIQVKSSGHELLAGNQSQMIVRNNTYTTNLSTIRTEPGQATAPGVAPVASMWKESDNTVSGIAMPPSFAEAPSAAPNHDSQSNGNEDGDLFINMGVTDSIEIRYDIPHDLSPDCNRPSMFDNELDVGSIAVKTTPLGSSDNTSGDQPEVDISESNPAVIEEQKSSSPSVTIEDTLDQGMAISARTMLDDIELDKAIDDAIGHDPAIDAVRTTGTNNTINVEHSPGSSQPNGYLDLTIAEDSSSPPHPFVDVNGTNTVINEPEPSSPHAVSDRSTQASPYIMMLTPAAMNRQASPADIEVRPPLPSDEIYDELGDDKLQTPPDAKKAKTRGASQHEESQQDSMRSTIHMESNPLEKKKSTRKRKYTNKTRVARTRSMSGSTSSWIEDATAQTPPEIQATASPLQTTSSARSTRSTLSRKPIEGYDMRIFFSSSTTIQDRKSVKEFLKTSMIRTAKSIDKCTHFCVGSKDELKKTSNLVKAVMSGKEVVNDKWLSDSAANGSLLDPNTYIPNTPSEWDIDLEEAVQRGRDRVRVLKDHMVYFTEDAKEELSEGYDDVRKIALNAGATEARCMKRADIKADEYEKEGIIYIAKGEDDLDWDHYLLQGLKVYTRDIVLMSILRGKLDLQSDEFVVKKSSAETKGKKRKRKPQS